MGEGAGDLRDFESVGEAAAEVVAGRIVGETSEDLGFSGEAAEGAGMEDACGVASEGGTVGMGRLAMVAPDERACAGDGNGSGQCEGCVGDGHAVVPFWLYRRRRASAA